jgi:predicted nucleic acid-binding protein
MTVVLDADVVIGALDARDAHHAAARERLVRWHEGGTRRLLGLMNLTEVLIAPAAVPARLAAAREAIATLGITIHAPNEAIAVDAARLRAAHPISLPDAYAIATARQVGGAIASFDAKVCRAAEREGVAAA